MVRTTLRFAVAALAVMGAVTSIAQAQPKAGAFAPGYLGVTLDGAPVMVGDSTGKVMAVTFWASWCAPCRAELPILGALQKVAGPDQIRVVAINIESAWEFRRLARQLSQLQVTLTHDADGKVSAAYGRKAIPHLVLIGRDGRILKVHRGYDEKHIDQIVADVNAALVAR